MSRKDAHALGRAIGLALFLVLQGGWIATLVNASDPTAELLGRDWSAFSVAGEKMLSGRSSEVYPVDFSTWPNPRLPNNLAYLYPPFSLYLTLPLGALPPFVAWALCWRPARIVCGCADLAAPRCRGVSRRPDDPRDAGSRISGPSSRPRHRADFRDPLALFYGWALGLAPGPRLLGWPRVGVFAGQAELGGSHSLRSLRCLATGGSWRAVSQVGRR